MKPILILLSSTFLILIIMGCESVSYKKTAGGMPYKIFGGKGGKKVSEGKHFKINLTQAINDSVYFSSQGKLALYFLVSDKPKPYDLSELWETAKVGDSIVTTQMMDTFIKRSPQMIPPEFKNGDRIITYIKILDVFDSDSAREADEKNERAKFLAEDIAFIEKYLGEKKIKSQRTPGGAFVEIIDPGKGNLIDSGNYVSVKYTGVTFDGVTFDSNTDSSFGHPEPLSFVVGTGSMIKGFDEAVEFLRNGAIAKFYIPSLLAFGSNPGSDKIKPFENIIFDIRVIDVQHKAPEQTAPQASQHTRTDTTGRKK